MALNGTNGTNGVHVPGAANGSAAVISAIAPAAVNGAAKDKAGGELSRDKLTDMLLAIVEEKTGYPRDMVGLDQSLESDLGIDSIKRIEVVGAMLQALPERYREALSASRSKLNTQATLEGMLSMMSAAGAEGAASVPFEVAGAETRGCAEPSVPACRGCRSRIDRRLCAQADHPRPLPDHRGRARPGDAGRLAADGPRLHLDPDRRRRPRQRGAARRLDRRAGCRPRDDRRRRPSRRGRRRLGGARRAACPPGASSSSATRSRSSSCCAPSARGWRATLTCCRSARSAAASAATPASPRGLSLQGGGVGLLKSLREERPTLRVKAVDVDPDAPLDAARRRADAGARARRRPPGSRLPGRRPDRVPHRARAVVGGRRAA